MRATNLRPITTGRRSKRGGDNAIRKWIDGQLYGKSVAIILIGAKTAGRKWIKYEIKKAWEEGKGVLGIYIHGMKDKNGNTTLKGTNPFVDFTVNGKSMSEIVKTYDPGNFFTSPYEHIKEDMAGWIETAIKIRGQHAK